MAPTRWTPGAVLTPAGTLFTVLWLPTHVSPRVLNLSIAWSIVGGGAFSFFAPNMRFMVT
jgi:hypothetical protein